MAYNLMWDLNTEQKIDGLTWWWWWWIFFIRDPANPGRTKQLMILWSTKNCDKIKVNDFPWERKRPIVQKDGKLNFDGMVCIWYYDGKTMHEPFAIEPFDFTTKWKDRSGILKPDNRNNFVFKGDPGKYRVKIEKDGYKFDFEMTPWNKFMDEQRYNANKYFGKMGYNILKIYGTKLSGSMESAEGGSEEVEGTAYFQKVMVNAPALPWYWAVIHIEDGSYIDYFMPHLGFSMLRRTEKPRSIWDFGELPLNRGLQFYIRGRDERVMFKKLSVVKKFTGDNLPIFEVAARKPGADISFTLRSYSRAYWRFEQPWWGKFNSIFYYNEYPVTMERFKYRDKKGTILLKDLGFVTGNCEHSWGLLWG